MDAIDGERIFNWDYNVAVRKVLFKLALVQSIQFVHVLKHQRAFGFYVESQDSVAAEFQHGCADVPASRGRQHVAMEGLSAQRARYRTIGTDEPQIEAELLHDGQREGVT